MKKIFCLVGGVYLTIKTLSGVYAIGEKIGEAKALYDLGKMVTHVAKEFEEDKESE